MYIVKRIISTIITLILTIALVFLVTDKFDNPAIQMTRKFLEETKITEFVGDVVEDTKEFFSNLKVPNINIKGNSTPYKNEIETPVENEETSDLESYTVEYVIDGDTFIVSMDGYSTKIRLIGVDTPESVASDAYLQSSGKENTVEGKEASNFTTDLITGETVYLEYDTDKTDKYGRTLAYVYLDENKETMLQDVLLEKGLACTLTVKPNTKYAAHFAEIEAQAKENGAGFWGTGFWD